MATAFSESEKELIRIKLNSAAQECLGKFGVKKTTVDQLAQMAGISKGAFYIFYPSKESLFFKVFEEYQNSIIDEMFNELNELESVGSEELSDLIYEIYKKVRHSFIMNIIENQELEYLMRKIPEKDILDHHSFDDIFIKKLLLHLKVKKDVEIGTVSASLRAIFMTMLHVKEIGEKDFDNALKLLISGLLQQLIEED
ncbi:AcrR family transcriptional regulator [Clostridium pascui]|uniref:TetR/AcrR family transcriptional regulator n=1 Tax=Clostridium pascui TaxID=46609 RepID=UPI00195DAE19|nr:TetR/AcrR family transcriptional regulator [Clostridium pascui]MBM7869782.1 AcrR family transcriptional regulator [Clostridium pascui]